MLEYNLDFQNVPTYCLRIWDFPPIVFEWAPGGGGQLNFWPFQNNAKSSTSKNTCTQVKMQKKDAIWENLTCKDIWIWSTILWFKYLNIFNILIFSIHKSTEETSLAKTSGYGALFFNSNILIFSNISIFSIHKSKEETSLAKTSGYGARSNARSNSSSWTENWALQILQTWQKK